MVEEHDKTCAERLKECKVEIKSWVADQICIATKGTKVKNVIYGTILFLMLGAALSSATVTVIRAQDANTTHVRNTADIGHLKEEVVSVKGDHKELVGTVHEMQKTQSRMDRNLSKLMGAMGVKAEEQ